jgi:hypothetical protein
MAKSVHKHEFGPPVRFTFLDEGRPSTGDAWREGARVWLEPPTLRDSFGWELKREGLCRDAVCIPLSARLGLVEGGRVDLTALADALGRPLVLDAEERAAYLGAAAQERAETLRSLVAPDFSLPDLDGKLHTLREQRGKKVLLVAYASW